MLLLDFLDFLLWPLVQHGSCWGAAADIRCRWPIRAWHSFFVACGGFVFAAWHTSDSSIKNRKQNSVSSFIGLVVVKKKPSKNFFLPGCSFGGTNPLQPEFCATLDESLFLMTATKNHTRRGNERQGMLPSAKKKRRKRPPSYPNHRYLLPENFAIPVELPELLSGRIEEGMWILHLLFGRKFYDARRIDPDRWYRLNVKKLRKTIFWSRVDAWIEFWISSGVIEPGGDGYVAGVRSRRYRMTAQYRTQSGKNYQLKDMRMRKKITEYQNEKKFWHDDPAYRKMEAYLRKISIRKQDAIDFVLYEKDYKDESIKNEEYARAVDLSCIEMLASPHRNFFVDRYGRVHTNLTNLSRELRQFLYLKNSDEKLSQTDIRNSQAFIYALLLKQLERIANGDPLKEKESLLAKIIKYTEEGIEEEKVEQERRKRERKKLQGELMKERYVGMTEGGSKEGKRGTEPREAEREQPSWCSSCAPKQQLNPLVPSTCGSVREFLGRATHCSETTCGDEKTQKSVSKAVFGLEDAIFVASSAGKFDGFIDSCCKGLLYENLNDSLPSDHEYRKMDRKAFKRTFFREAIFCRNKLAKDKPLKDVFSEMFPDAWDVICLLKQGHHAVLPKLLQNIESEYVIGAAAKAFMKKHPKAFLATVHDSLMVESRFRQDASEALVDAFADAGLSPSVSAETVTWY